MNKSLYLAGLAVLAQGSVPLFADELEPIFVTAARTAQSADETLASVTLITQEDIQRLQAQSLPDLLRGLPGLAFSNNGGPGKVTSLYLRGSEADHVLVLVDGVKIGSATSGTAAFQDIPLSQIERIEIVRGPRSSLYGSEAIGGVIQIFTARGGGPLRGDLSLELGSHDTRGGSASLSGGGDQGWYRLSVEKQRTDGIDACRNITTAGCYSDEPDKDGYTNESATLRTGYRFNDQFEVDAHLWHTHAETDFDGSYVNESESYQQVFGGSLRYHPMESWLLTLAGGRHRDKADNFENGLFMSRFDTERDSYSLQSDYDINADHQVTLGLDYQKDKVDSTVAYEVTSREDTGIFTQYQGVIANQDLQLALRRDDHDAFGKHNTGNLAWGYDWSSGLRTLISYGTAFKTPTFNELYYPGFGNPDLEPEESKSLELGVSGDLASVEWSFNLFRTWVDQLIGFDANYQPANIDQARIDGLESRFSTKLLGWRLDTNLTLLDPRNRTGGSREDNLLPRRARRSLRIDLDRDFDRYTLGATLNAEGSRYEDLDNNNELGGYGTLDLRASYRIASAWQLQGRCENLFDKSYTTAAYYNQPGRSVYLTLRYQP
jgi:vitamin B12 transporter